MGKKEDYGVPTDTFCILPWIHLHTTPTGQAAPCCISNSCADNIGVGNSNTDSLEEIVNSPKMKKLRVDMINGVKNEECTNCHRHDEKGVPSARVDFNNTWMDKKDVLDIVKNVERIYDSNTSLSILKDFERVVQSQHGKITIKNEGGKIKADINLDSIVAGIEREYKSKMQSKSEVTEKIVVKEKKPLWVYLLIVYSVVITALYIKRLFRI